MTLSTIVYSGVPGAPRHSFLAGDHDSIKTVHEVFDNTYALGLPELAKAIVVDVGANVGAFTILALDHDARGVVAVEPDPASLAWLTRNVADSGYGARVHVLRGAAGDGADPQALGQGAGVHRTTASAEAGPALPTWGLAYLLGLARELFGDDARIVLKVDCEGCEYALFAAVEPEELTGISLIRCEWHGNIAAGQPGALGRIGPLVEKLLCAEFSVTLFGNPAAGGMLHAHH